MTIKEICSAIAKSEHKRVQVSIGNIREVVGIISDLVSADCGVIRTLGKNGDRRARRKRERGKTL
jgi:hypothetical protein